MMPTGTYDFSADMTVVAIGLFMLFLAVLLGYILHRHSRRKL